LHCVLSLSLLFFLYFSPLQSTSTSTCLVCAKFLAFI
jgi:hypothetical protein